MKLFEGIEYDSLKDLPFYDEMERMGGKIYSVGGQIRDELLGKESKDLDVVVTGIKPNIMLNLLKKYGNADMVGSSFGVIKFIPYGKKDDIDIAFPRKEVPFYGYELLSSKGSAFIPVGKQKALKYFTKLDPKDYEFTKKIMNDLGIRQGYFDGNEEELKARLNHLKKGNLVNDVKKKSGYTGFITFVDHTMSIEQDLKRRDLTIGSMARDADGNIIDPFDGQRDIRDRVIRATSQASFEEDPLRMLRAVQFAARFDFEIEEKTMQMIQNNSEKIDTISHERIVIEFEKMIQKGDPYIGIQKLVESGLFNSLFKTRFEGDMDHFKMVKTIAEFIFLCLKDSKVQPDNFYKQRLKNFDKRNLKEIEAYMLYNEPENKTDLRYTIFQMNDKSPDSIETAIFDKEFEDEVQKMKNNQYPLTLKDLKVNGNDVKNLVKQKRDIKDLLIQGALLTVYSDNAKNEKQDILNSDVFKKVVEKLNTQ